MPSYLYSIISALGKSYLQLSPHAERFRFPVPGSHGHRQANVLNEIERQASEAWGSGIRAQAAYDYLNVEIPVPHPREKAERGDDDSNGMLEGKRKDRSWEQGGSTGDRNYDHEHKRG